MADMSGGGMQMYFQSTTAPAKAAASPIPRCPLWSRAVTCQDWNRTVPGIVVACRRWCCEQYGEPAAAWRRPDARLLGTAIYGLNLVLGFFVMVGAVALCRDPPFLAIFYRRFVGHHDVQHRLLRVIILASMAGCCFLFQTSLALTQVRRRGLVLGFFIELLADWQTSGSSGRTSDELEAGVEPDCCEK
jgi:hypothetical protein